MNKLLFHQNEFTRTSFSATVTGVSNFVEENACFLFVLFFTWSRLIRPGAFSHFKYVNRNALSMFKH